MLSTDNQFSHLQSTYFNLEITFTLTSLNVIFNLHNSQGWMSPFTPLWEPSPCLPLLMLPSPPHPQMVQINHLLIWQTSTATQWNIIQPLKGIKCWYTLQYGWIWKMSCLVKEASHKWSLIICFYFNEMSSTSKSKEIINRLVVSRDWGRRKWGLAANGYRVSFRNNENVQKLDSVSNIYIIYTHYVVYEYTKNTGLYTFKRWSHSFVEYKK